MRKVAMKYRLEPDEINLGVPFVLELPKAATILSVRAIREVPYIYALVDEGGIIRTQRKLVIYNTGQPFELEPKSTYIHLGTMQLGDDILHLFEINKG